MGTSEDVIPYPITFGPSSTTSVGTPRWMTTVLSGPQLREAGTFVLRYDFAGYVPGGDGFHFHQVLPSIWLTTIYSDYPDGGRQRIYLQGQLSETDTSYTATYETGSFYAIDFGAGITYGNEYDPSPYGTFVNDHRNATVTLWNGDSLALAGVGQLYEPTDYAQRLASGYDQVQVSLSGAGDTSWSIETRDVADAAIERRTLYVPGISGPDDPQLSFNAPSSARRIARVHVVGDTQVRHSDYRVPIDFTYGPSAPTPDPGGGGGANGTVAAPAVTYTRASPDTGTLTGHQSAMHTRVVRYAATTIVIPAATSSTT